MVLNKINQPEARYKRKRFESRAAFYIFDTASIKHMKLIRKFVPLLFVALVISTTTSGCFLFRKKNNCGSCPSFSGKPKR